MVVGKEDFSGITPRKITVIVKAHKKESMNI